MLNDAQIDRFSRHILLKEIGGAGQEKLLGATVRLRRLDEASRACALWLVRAGVGALDLPEDEGRAPVSDGAGLLHAADAGRALSQAVRERLGFHGAVSFRAGGIEIDPGASVEEGVRAALEAVRAILKGAG